MTLLRNMEIAHFNPHSRGSVHLDWKQDPARGSKYLEISPGTLLHFNRLFFSKFGKEYFPSTWTWKSGHFNWLLVFSAIDSMDGNYPCLPMDNYQTCLSWEFVEVACGLLDRVSPEMADVLFLQGYNHRLGTSGLNMMEIVKATDVLYPGFSGILPALPEQDQWEYPTHHDGQPIRGPARVCSALVCEMLRAGGVFGNHDVSCTEFTPWDIYSMDVFTSPTYQLKGDYAIDLTKPEPLRLGQKSITNYMAETCRTQITDESYYERAPHC